MSISILDRVIRGPYFHDLLAQPDAVQLTLESFAKPSAPALRDFAIQRRFSRVVLTGMGSSLAALHPLAIRLIDHGGLTAMIVDTSELIHSMPRLLVDSETLVVAVSQSGRSAEIVRLVNVNARPPLIAVTNTPDSPLALGADATVLTHAGAESTVSCKTYVATLAALAFLGDVLCEGHEARDLIDENVPAQMKAYLDQWQSHVEELAPICDGARDVFFAGRGTSLAAAYTAGLIVKESTRYHAEGMTSAALRHGPMEMASDRMLALIYEGDSARSHVADLNRGLVADLRRAGARAHLVGEGAELASLRVHGMLQEILAAQMLSITLAAHAGMEAGRFLHATKVTATE